MSSQSPSPENNTTTEMETSHPTVLAGTRDYATSGGLKEKHNGVAASPTGDNNNKPVEPEYATGLKLFLVMLSICMAALLTALEIGIIATAIPKITDEFHSLSDVGWYGCATFLIVAASSAMWGKLYKYLNVKYVFLASIALFLVGSIPAAAAPNSRSVIVGRAIQGWGIPGTMSGSIIVINYVSHPKSHPLLIGIWTGIFMVSTILGPVIGGAFTSGSRERELCSNSAFYQVMFYLPIYFQSIHGQSAIMSGVNSLPFLAFFALGAVLSGTAIGKTRHLQPYQLVSTLLMTSGMALLYELGVDSSKSWYIGAEVLFGFGVGLGNQVPVNAVQGLSKPEDVPSSTALMFMCQSGSGAVFIVMAQSIFANCLLREIRTTAPNLNATQVMGSGASDIHDIFSGGDLDAVLKAYMVGIKDVFACALASSALAAIVALIIPLKKLPSHGKKDTEGKGAPAQA